MTVSVLAAAKYAGHYSDWSLSNLVLQKITYLAHMWHYGEKDEPFIRGSFEAWDYGPVHPDLYHHVKCFGSNPVKNIFRSVSNIEDKYQIGSLESLVDNFAGKPARLVEITHWDKGAWYKNYEPGRRQCTISDEDIIEEYNAWVNGDKESKSRKS